MLYLYAWWCNYAVALGQGVREFLRAVVFCGKIVCGVVIEASGRREQALSMTVTRGSEGSGKDAGTETKNRNRKSRAGKSWEGKRKKKRGELKRLEKLEKIRKKRGKINRKPAAGSCSAEMDASRPITSAMGGWTLRLRAGRNGADLLPRPQIWGGETTSPVFVSFGVFLSLFSLLRLHNTAPYF